VTYGPHASLPFVSIHHEKLSGECASAQRSALPLATSSVLLLLSDWCIQTPYALQCCRLHLETSSQGIHVLSLRREIASCPRRKPRLISLDLLRYVLALLANATVSDRTALPPWGYLRYIKEGGSVLNPRIGGRAEFINTLCGTALLPSFLIASLIFIFYSSHFSYCNTSLVLILHVDLSTRLATQQ